LTNAYIYSVATVDSARRFHANTMASGHCQSFHSHITCNIDGIYSKGNCIR